MTSVHVQWEMQATLGEGPVWDAASGCLYFVDILDPHIHRLEVASGEKNSFPMAEEVGAIAICEDGGLVAAMRSGFAFIDLDTGTVTPIHDPERDLPGNRFNDGKVDALGRFWAGTMDYDCKEETGALYRLNTDLSVKKMDSGYVCVNGPAFSPGGTRIYHTDSPRRVIYASDLADGALINKQPFVTFSDGWGVPDGMTVDSTGGLWVCHWGGARITRFTADGTADQTVDIPARNVTSCCFGGEGLSTLYITTARYGLDENTLKASPLSGSVFSVETGFCGSPTPRFQGRELATN